MAINDIANLHRNIGYLIKAYKVRIGDLERAIGVSVGYLSRSMNVDMPISKVLKIADFFEITVDELVRGNYRKAFLEGEIKRLQKELDALELAKELENCDKAIRKVAKVNHTQVNQYGENATHIEHVGTLNL